MTIQDMAKAREAAWIEANGHHEYDDHDLVADAREELSDAWNYLSAEVKRLGKGDAREPLVIARQYLADVWYWLDVHEGKRRRRS